MLFVAGLGVVLDTARCYVAGYVVLDTAMGYLLLDWVLF